MGLWSQEGTWCLTHEKGRYTMGIVTCQQEEPTTHTFGKAQQTLNAKMGKIKGISKLAIAFMCCENTKSAVYTMMPNSRILREINQGRGTQGSSTGFLKMGKSLVSSYNYRRMTPQQEKEKNIEIKKTNKHKKPTAEHENANTDRPRHTFRYQFFFKYHLMFSL